MDYLVYPAVQVSEQADILYLLFQTDAGRLFLVLCIIMSIVLWTTQRNQGKLLDLQGSTAERGERQIRELERHGQSLRKIATINKRHWETSKSLSEEMLTLRTAVAILPATITDTARLSVQEVTDAMRKEFTDRDVVIEQVIASVEDVRSQVATNHLSVESRLDAIVTFLKAMKDQTENKEEVKDE